MLIDSIISHSEVLYDQYGVCGHRCTHPSGRCNSCGSCYECSKQIHFPDDYSGTIHRISYDCQKLIYYYACRYTWKYCSEIMYALELFDLSRYKQFDMLSIGCGPSPDLMALECENRDHKTISYTGIDINPYWGRLHECVQNYCQSSGNMSCRYYYTDIVEFLNVNRMQANIIVMSYIISSIPASERIDRVNELYKLLIHQVVSCKGQEPLLIVINDIDRWSIRPYFSLFVTRLGEAGFHGVYFRRHFKTRGMDYNDGSVQYSSCANKFSIPADKVSKFDCAVYCSSAQYIIEVR